MKDDRDNHPPRTPEQIAEIIARYRASGLALDRFAEQNGIPRGRLHYWVYQKQPVDGALAYPKGQAAVAPAFEEIKLGGQTVPAGHLVEVSLLQGIAIRFSGAVTPEWIGAVVQALQRSC
jgi:transposase-like protein